jgi:thiol-disulfide isomerase/thioredoxin
MLAGAPAISYAIPRIGGGTDSVAAHRGSIVLMNFWATWCPPCQEEMPALETLYRNDRARGLVVLGIDQGESAAKAAAFAKAPRRDVSDPRRRGSTVRNELRVGWLADHGRRRP